MITNGWILIVQVGLLALFILLAFRVITLVQSEPLSTSHQSLQPSTERPQDRAELISQLHILAGLQERDCRVKGLDLSTAPEAVKTYAALWLYGAGCALSDKVNRHSEVLVTIVAQISSRKTGLEQPSAIQAINTLTNSAICLACFRAGLEGAEFWQYNRFVPYSSGLYEAITANAFI